MNRWEKEAFAPLPPNSLTELLSRLSTHDRAVVFASIGAARIAALDEAAAVARDYAHNAEVARKAMQSDVMRTAWHKVRDAAGDIAEQIEKLKVTP